MNAITQPTPGQDHLTSSEQSFNPGRLFFQIGVIVCIISSVLALLAFVNALQKNLWQFFALAIILLTVFIVCLLGITKIIKGDTTQKLAVILAVDIAFILVSSLIKNFELTSALSALVFTIIASSFLPGKTSQNIIILGIVLAMSAVMAGMFPPYIQIDIPLLVVFIPAFLGILVMAYIALMEMEYTVATIRIKLIIFSLIIVLIPAIFFTTISTLFLQSTIQNQTNQSLKTAASETAKKIDDFLNSNRESVYNAAVSYPQFSNFLSTPAGLRRLSQEETDLRLIMAILRSSRDQLYLDSIGLLDSFGVNVIDSNQVFVGEYETDQDYFKIPFDTGRNYISPVSFSLRENKTIIFFSAPVRETGGRIIGVFRVRFNAQILQRIIEQNINLVGNSSYPILVDENYMRLADAITPQNLYRSIAPYTTEQFKNLRGLGRIPFIPYEQLSTNLPEIIENLKSFSSKPFFTAEFHDTPEHNENAAAVTTQYQPWLVVYVQDQQALLQVLAQQGKLSAVIATLIIGLASLLATFLTRSISNPIIKLTDIAGQITSGELEAKADVETNDEIGALGRAFNLMTFQLRNFIGDLENRVRSRTQELAAQNKALSYRSQQLQTISEVTRGIASSQDLEQFLSNITILISQRFGFYQVGVFLVDENREYAILRAANSEGGKRMLASQHKLKVGQVGIVGYVTGTGSPRVTTDVGKDAVFFDNPELPSTRSEMALPLKTGDRIIGALDVQSEKSNAFSNEDIELFSILADQLAIAIINFRLYSETTKALEDSQKLHQQYLHQEWIRATSERPHAGYLFSRQKLVTLQEEVNRPEITAVLQTGEPYVEITKSGEQEISVLVVPIMLRNEIIGIIHLQEQGIEGREWNGDEINTVKAIADQIAVALENARLFEQTIRRADRERRVMEITSKIRETNDPQTMLKVAAEELQKTLNASRTQVILQKPETSPDQPPHKGNGDESQPTDTELS